MRKYKLSLLFLAAIFQSCLDFDLNWGNVTGEFETTVVPLEQIEGEYEGDIKYWITDQEYLPELSKDYGYKTSIRMIDPGRYTISFDSTFIYQLSELNFKITSLSGPNTIVLEDGQDYDHWFPIAYDEYAGHFAIDTIHSKTIWFSMSIQSIDQDSTRRFTFYGNRDI